MASNVVAIVRNEFAVRTWKSLHLLVNGGDMALQVVARVAANKGEIVYVEKKTSLFNGRRRKQVFNVQVQTIEEALYTRTLWISPAYPYTLQST